MRAARLLATLGMLCGLLAFGATPAQADDEPIRVGTESTYSPFSFVDNDNRLTGYDVEVMRAIAEKAGWQPDFVTSSWDALFAALDADRVDTIANQVTINPEREAQYVFSEPYTYSRGVIVTRADDDSIKTLAASRAPTSAIRSRSPGVGCQGSRRSSFAWSAYRGITCRWKWKTVCQASAPQQLSRLTPSAPSSGTATAAIRCAAIATAARSSAGISSRSLLCRLGITSRCPSVPGLMSMKA